MSRPLRQRPLALSTLPIAAAAGATRSASTSASMPTYTSASACVCLLVASSLVAAFSSAVLVAFLTSSSRFFALAPLSLSRHNLFRRATFAPRAATVADWVSCSASTDACQSAGWVCCVAPTDTDTGKTTCRPQDDCAAVLQPVADWNTCNSSSDVCQSPGWVCCVAPSDAASGKTTCRPNTDCSVAVDDWMTCNAGDTCVSSGFVCCIGDADLSTGKRTCRQGTLPGPDCHDSTTASDGFTVNDGMTCTINSVCLNPGSVCCIAPGDEAIGKTTCLSPTR
ncbi:hypothetical protein HDU84_001691 [Entophlyctis sp. JEL0112]|nr:hypothetical protein HDU84_001691 [Entophlyctis sp. JEL0112]